MFFNFCKNKVTSKTIEEKKDINFDESYYLDLEYPHGTKIILISNEPSNSKNGFDELEIGYVSHIETITQSKTPVIAYTKENENDIFITLNKPLKYSIELETALLKLNWAERWNIFNKGNMIIDEETKNRKEKNLIKE